MPTPLGGVCAFLPAPPCRPEQKDRAPEVRVFPDSADKKMQSQKRETAFLGGIVEVSMACCRVRRPRRTVYSPQIWAAPDACTCHCRGAACRSPTMAGACIGSGPNLRAVHGASGTPHPTTRHRYFNNTPQKCSLSFLRLHFFIGRIGKNAHFRCAILLLRATGRRGQESADSSERSWHDVVLSDNIWAKCTKSGEIS